MVKKMGKQKQFLKNNILVTVEEDTSKPTSSTKFRSFGQNSKKERILSNCDDLSSKIRRTRKELKILTKMKKKLIREGTCPVTQLLPPKK